MSRIGLSFVSVALVMATCGVQLSGQDAKLTGTIHDKAENKPPIKGVVVAITKLQKTSTSNGDGVYEISGLHRGQKVRVEYSKPDYARCFTDIDIGNPVNTYNVEMYAQDKTAHYWVHVSSPLLVIAQPFENDSQAQLMIYSNAWKEVDDSALIPEAKVAAAHEFAAAMKPALFAKAPQSLRDYSRTDPDLIPEVKNAFGYAISGNGHLVYIQPQRMVPSGVAVDIAADQIYVVKMAQQPFTGAVFYDDFGRVYGKNVVAELKTKVEYEESGGSPCK